MTILKTIYNRLNQNLSKYFHFTMLSIKSAGIGTAGHFGAFIGISSRIFALYLFYFATLSTQPNQQFQSFTLNSIVWILAIGQLISTSTGVRPYLYYTIREEIQSGQIGQTLIRPISFFWAHLASYLGKTTIVLIRNTIFTLITCLILLGLPPDFNLTSIAAFLFLSILAVFLKFQFMFFIGIITFWLEENSFLSWGLQKCEMVLGGLFIPLAFFPEPLKHIATILPFSQMLYFPSQQLIQPNLSTFQTSLIILTFWIIISSVTISIIYKQAQQNVLQNGG